MLRQPDGTERRLFAHRGLHRSPREENTLRALGAAAERLGGFECDVRFSADGVPVVVHDATLWRTHRDPAPVARLAAARLRRRGVPSLAAVLRRARRGRGAVVLDLKARPRRAMALAGRLARRHQIRRSRVIYLVWDDEPCPEAYGTVYRARDFVFEPAVPPGCAGIAARFDGSAANRRSIDRALAAGLAVNLYAEAHRVPAMLGAYTGRCSFTADVAPGPPAPAAGLWCPPGNA